jgi:ATP/ADP translocase
MSDPWGDMMLWSMMNNAVNAQNNAQIMAEIQLRAQVDPVFAAQLREYYRQQEIRAEQKRIWEHEEFKRNSSNIGNGITAVFVIIVLIFILFAAAM